jgi:hypothetical protein
MRALPQGARRALALLAVLALSLSSCGGGEEESSSSETASAAPPTAITAPEQRSAPAGQAPAARPPEQGSDDPGEPAHREGSVGQPTAGAKAPAPGVPVTPGGDNSIQTFGAEGEETERQQAEANLKAYLSARAQGDWAGACEAASEPYREELAKLIENAKAKQGAEKPKGCPETLEALFGKAPAPTLQEAAQVNQVLSFRVEEDGYAYLIFKGAKAEVKFIAMADDEGTWKVNTVEPSAFEGPTGEAQ